MTPTDSGYILDSGRFIFADQGILGIADSGAYRGQNGVLDRQWEFGATYDVPEYDWPLRALSVEERREIADYAKALWDEWAGRVER